MFEKLLIKKEEIGKIKLKAIKPFDITSEKVTLAPRTFNTSQIKDALENIDFAKIEEQGPIPSLYAKTSEYILKDFFLRMHQTGLYNRQLNLWKVMGLVTGASFYKLQKGLLNKSKLNVSMADFFTEPENVCIRSLINHDTNINQSNLKSDLSLAVNLSSKKKLRGVFYFVNNELTQDFINSIDNFINASNLTTKCESVIHGTKDVRLNVISITQENNNYSFKHIYPQIK